jgi:AcrR family transcriptional regulator
MTQSGAEDRGEETLDRDAIVRFALDQINENGLENFSMRGLARELGFYPAAIYWHISDRSTLLTEVSALLMSFVEVPDRHVPWDSWIRTTARNYREVLYRYPRAAPLLTASIVTNSELDFGFADATLDVLAGAGFRGQGLVDAYNVVIGCVVGFLGLELAASPDDEKWTEAREAEWQHLDHERYPRIAESRELLDRGAFVIRRHSGVDLPLDGAFEAAVDTVIRGLRSRLEDSRSEFSEGADR